jgi:hypothetical protein
MTPTALELRQDAEFSAYLDGPRPTHTLGLYLQTKTTWLSVEIVRTQFSLLRRAYRDLVQRIRELPDDMMRMDMKPGESPNDVRADMPNSMMYITLLKGKWTEDEQLQMLPVAFHLVERSLTDLQLSPDLISAVRLRMWTEAGEWVCDPMFVLHRSAAQRENEFVSDGQHRMIRPPKFKH